MGRRSPGRKSAPRARIAPAQSETTSAEDGTFTLPQLTADTYQISASAAGYSESAVVVELGVGQTREVELKLNTSGESTLNCGVERRRHSGLDERADQRQRDAGRDRGHAAERAELFDPDAARAGGVEPE